MHMETSEHFPQRPSPLLSLIEGRALIELLGFYFHRNQLNDLPRWMTSDTSTVPLRGLLKDLGYAAHGWGLGRNLIASEQMERNLADRVDALTDRYGRKVSLIGWSAGGVYARVIAHQMEGSIRQVITLGSPFRGIKGATNVEWLYEWVTGESIDDADRQVRARAAIPPPVPATAIYSKGDGIVHWEACREAEEGHLRQNIEVAGSHTGLGHNPEVLKCIADRLSLPEGEWRPYELGAGRPKREAESPKSEVRSPKEEPET